MASAELPPIRRIDRDKVEGYLLHPVKAHGKAQFFERFGFDRSRWHEFRTALLEHATGGTVIERASSPYGVRYTVRGKIQTPSGRQPPSVCSVWQADVGENAVRLITAYPDLLPANLPRHDPCFKSSRKSF